MELSINPWLALGLILLGLALSAAFAAAEAALASASRTRMAALEAAGEARAGGVGRLLDRRERLAGALLVGRALANAAVAALAALLLGGLFGAWGLVGGIAAAAVLIVVAAEIAPRTLASFRAEQAVLALARPASRADAVLGPLFLAAEAAARTLLRPLGLAAGEHRNVLSAAQDLREALERMHREGALGQLDRAMVGGLLDLKDLVVSDVMVHRTKMVALDVAEPPERIVREVLAAPYTRIPLWRGSPENIVGVLHGKDLLRALAAAGGDAGGIDIAAIALPPWFVPDSTRLQDQLKAFLRRKTHFALVVDEYGDVLGLVTLEDIIEEIVGDIRDEHDVQVTGVRPQRDGSVNVDGSVPIRDLNRVMGWALPDEEATTIAGLVIHEARSIPDAGQTFTFHGFRFRVLRKQRNRITALKIVPLERKGETP